MTGTPAARRILGVSLLAIFLAAPALAATSNQGECRRITRQLDHYEDVAMMAAQRGDERWFDGTVEHMKRLGERRIRLCPEYEEPDYGRIYTEWAMWMMRRAADVFLAYTTFGTYGAF